jgi:hypothetical protein
LLLQYSDDLLFGEPSSLHLGSPFVVSDFEDPQLSLVEIIEGRAVAEPMPLKSIERVYEIHGFSS